MSSYSEWVSVAVVFAVNLVVVGGILTGGLALVFRLLENIAPRVRYVLGVTVFLLTILIPAAACFNQPLGLGLTDQSQNAVSSYETSSGASDSALAETTAGTGFPTQASLMALPNRFSFLLTNSRLGSAFLGLWILGTIFLGLREIFGLVQLRRTRSRWELATPTEQAELGCPAWVSLYVADAESPGTVGFLSPAIVIPRHFPSGLSIEAKRLVIQHELSHARWRDPLLGLTLRSIRALFWISPALWLIGRIIEREREAAADRAAISSPATRSVRDDSAFAYAETLMTVAQHGVGQQQRIRRLLTTGLSGRPSQLEARIRRIFSAAHTTQRQWAGAIAVLIVTVTVLLLTPFATVSAVCTTSATLVDENSVISLSKSDGVNPTLQPTDLASQAGSTRSSSRTPRRPVRRPNGTPLAPVSYERMVGLSGLRRELAPLRELNTGP